MFMCFKISTKLIIIPPIFIQKIHVSGLEIPAICLFSHWHCFMNGRWMGIEFMQMSLTGMLILNLGYVLIFAFSKIT